MIKPVVLLILDGWGLNEDKEYNAIQLADAPNYLRITEKYPMTKLQTSGLFVGLPQGQMGNSEVGHLNIGSGRVVYQDLTRLDKEIETGAFFKNPVLSENMDKAIIEGKAIHLLGLLSDGGVHSHIRHAEALIKMAKEKGVKELYLHCLLDGRDVPPQSAAQYIKEIEKYMELLGLGKIATIEGRYYAMDRDKRWGRVELGYKAIANAEGKKYSTALEVLEDSYSKDVVDEFVVPAVIGNYKGLNDGDALILYNFRGDRAREISQVFFNKEFKDFPIRKLDINYVCMTEYDGNLGAPIAYPPEKLVNTLGKYLSDKGIHQIRIAETEKYAHVTFFFNGGVEASNPLEDRILVPSPKVATYDLKPEMSLFEVCDKILEVLKENKHEVLIINFANGDMVGHSGKLSAAIKAVEAVDKCLGQISQKVLDLDGTLLVTADHGNCEYMHNYETDGPHTAHTVFPVPFIVVSNKGYKLRQDEDLSLKDISPTILKLLKLEVPEEMTGKSIIIE